MIQLDLANTFSLQLAIVSVSVCALLWLFVSKRKKKLPLPPLANASLLENISASTVQKGLFQLERYHNFVQSVGDGEFGRNLKGSTLRLRSPFFRHWIITTDYTLARAVLAGEAKLGIKEGERSSLSRTMNFLDRNEFSILTFPTANKEREKARKDIAQAFSTSNLLQAWPAIYSVLDQQFTALEVIAAKKEVIDVKSTVVQFFMRTLSRGAFGVDFTDDGTETEDTINGLEYLQAMETSAREMAREFIFPLRRFMFWDEGVQRNKSARKVLRRIAHKILLLHHKRQETHHATGEGMGKAVSVLDHVAHHSYAKEITRLSDVTIFSFAGIDTTSYTFCFLLMELCRHPEQKLRLQCALAEFMPALPWRTHTEHATATSTATAAAASSTATATGNVRHDKELLGQIANCEFLTQCVREILRLWPVAALGAARDIPEDIEYDGMLLPAGSFVVAQFWSMFRERWIDRADAFVPARWAETNPQLPQLREMLLPFGAGRRNCIGQNMALFQLKIVAAHFLHYFDFELVGEPTFEFFLTLKPDQLRMRVTKREC